MQLPTRRLCLKIAAASGFSALHASAYVQEVYPNRSIKLVYPLAAGTGGDLIARVTAAAMTSELGQSVYVDNKVGAGGVVGMNFVAKAAPDGYTLALAPIGAAILIPAMSDKVPYKVDKDFVPVAYLGHTPMVVVTSEQPDRPRTLQDLLAQLRQRGGDYGSVGRGTAVQLATELLLKRAGVQATYIGYRGSSQALTALVGGEVLFSIDTPAATQPLIEAGKLRPLAVTVPRRIPSMPDVPTVSESGVPDFEATAWWGILAPANTPSHIVAKLSEVTMKVLAASEVKSKFAGLGAEASPLPSAEFGKLIVRADPWASLIKELNIRID